MAGSGETKQAGADIKLSCRHVWKVYGDQAASYFKREVDSSSPDQLSRRMRADGAITAAVDVSFDVRVGEIFVIMGLSGSGKSTVVRCLSRLVEPSHGAVLLDDEDLLQKSSKELIDIRRHKMGMVFQNFGLMPHLTVLENIAFPLRLQGLDLKRQRERAARVIELVGLEGREASFPRQLSGGQQQRVGIARSLAVEPELWFLDEPFSALDPLIRRQMQDEFLRIQSALKKSIVFITHDFLEALRVADRMMIMRDGLVVQMGTPAELIINPADEYVADFTSDVPLARVLRAGDIMQAPQEISGDVPQVTSDTTLEKLLSVLASSDAVSVAEEGRIVGTITPKTVVSALARGAAPGNGQASQGSADVLAQNGEIGSGEMAS